MDQRRALPRERLGDRRMGVAQAVDRDAAAEIEVVEVRFGEAIVRQIQAPTAEVAAAAVQAP